MKSHWTFKAVLLFTGLSLILSSCAGPTPAAPTSEPPAPAAPTALPTPDLGLLLSQAETDLQVSILQPGAGAEASLTDPLEIQFDRPVDQSKVESAFHLLKGTTSVSGQFNWPSPERLVFQPSEPLAAGASYEILLDETAAGDDGSSLAEPFQFAFSTTAPLAVSQVFPSDGAQDIDPHGQIAVMFNRPVTALQVGADPSALPQPLVFTPPAEGSGEWVSTSVYIFKPTAALNTGTEYTLTITGGLNDVSGDPALAMTEDFTAQFSTRSPGVLSFETGDQYYNVAELQNGADISPLPEIKITFLQAMDAASTQRAIHIAGTELADIPFTIKWDEGFTAATIKPQRYLLNGADYTLTVGAQAQAADGGLLGSDLQWVFRTAEPAGITMTTPQNGGVSTDLSFTISFASRMKVSTIADRVLFNPPLERKDWWYNEYTKEAVFYGLKPSTKYRVTIQPGMLSQWDQAINTTSVVEFTTSPLSPSVYLNLPYNAVFRQGIPQTVYISHTNVNAATLKLYKVTAEDYIRSRAQSYSSDIPSFVNAANLVWERQIDFESILDEPGQQEVDLSDPSSGQALAPGIYFLTLDSPDIEHQGSYLDSRSLVVTGAYMVFKNAPGDALLWAVDPQSGEPVSGAKLMVYSDQLKVLGRGTTDEDGLLHLDLDTTGETNYWQRFAVTDGDGPFIFAESAWTTEAGPDAFGIQTDYSGQLYNATAYLYTDRPLYRPGQPVYYKGVVRVDNDLAYRLPDEQQVEIVINSYEKEISRQTVSLSTYGTFDGKLDLDPEATLGGYFISARFPGQEDRSLGMINFTVAEYRKPEFQLDLTAEPADLLAGETLTAQLAASYYAGGPLVNAQVDWNLRSDPFFFTPPSTYSGFSFSDDSRDAGRDGVRLEEEYGKLIAEGSGTTDAEGSLEINIPVTAQGTAGSRSLTLETNVTDFSGNSVAGQAKAVAHTALVYAGVKPDVYVGTVGKDLAFELVTLDWAGKPAAGMNMDIDISERQWFSVQEEDAQGVLHWKSTVKDVPVTKFSGIKSGEDGLASVSFTPDRGGVFRALVTVYDGQGNQNRSAAYVWVAGSDYIPWRQNDDRTFQVVSDKDTYQAGDTASLLIASPFQGEAYALVTVERGRVRSQEVVLLTGNSTVYELPITGDMSPVVYASIVVVKGIDETNPRPSYKIGMARLNVESEKQTLQVKVTPDKEEARPGDQVTYTVETLDSAGKGVSAEVSLGLTDLATLSLMPSNSVPLQEFFYSERGIAVTTGITLSVSMEDYNEMLKSRQAEGRSAGSGGGKGDEALPGVPGVRQDFPDTAYWQAHLVTDQNGKAAVTVTLPDNLTTWRMDARAVTLDTQVGQAQVDIVSSRPLLVRPQTPRFFVAGDQAVVGAAVHNNTGQALKTEVSLQAEGAELKTPASQTVDIPAGGQVLINWETTIPVDSQRVDLVFSAAGGDYQDASRPTTGTLDNQGIPVYRYEAPETAGTSGVLAAAGSRAELVRLPEGTGVTQGGLTVTLEPSLAAGMTAGLNYLKYYPYECTEQTVSRFLPNLLSLRALRAAGLNDAVLEEELKTQVTAGLQKLISRQNVDGGWGWWVNERSDALTSAYVALGLIEANKNDFTVDPTALQNALTFLQSATLEADLQTREGLNRQAFLLYVLARAGQPEVSQSVRLYESRAAMDFYARGFLAQALAEANPTDSRLAAMASDLVGAASISAAGAHWTEEEADWKNWNTNTRTTAILLSTLIRLDPQNDLLPNVVRWLMTARTDGRWKSTQETAWTLMALTDWMTASGELQANYTYAAGLNGEELGGGAAQAGSLKEAETLTVAVADLLKDEANRLVITRSGGPGSLYYTAYLNASLPVAEIQPLNRGITISRRYYRPDDLKTPVVSAAQGETLLVKLTLVVPQDLHYALITDPLPAGLEAIDSQLRSSPQFEQPYSYDWDDFESEGWGWWYFSHAELRDEKVVLSASYLPAGSYTYTYRVRASTPGTFNVIPPTAEEFYFPDVSGRGEGSLFEVTP